MAEIPWQFLIFLIGLLTVLVGGAIQIGALRSQIMINTDRLGKIEDFLNGIRTHMSDTHARWPDIERRITRLESIVNHITIDLSKFKKVID